MDQPAVRLITAAVGGALLHSVWQGALVAVVTTGLLRALRRATAEARYLVSCLGLVTLTAAWLSTAVVLGVTAARVVDGSSGIDEAYVPAALGPAGPRDRSPAIRVVPCKGELACKQALETLPPAGRDWWAMLRHAANALVPVWFAGVLLLSMRLGLDWRAVVALRRGHDQPAPLDVATRVAALATRVGITRAVSVVQSPVVFVPSVVGWLRPVILVPVGALTGLSVAQLDAILAHELAHVRRYDYAVNAVQSLVDILLFYHPVCWWLSRRIRDEREHSCDDIAVALCGDRVTYAAALAELEVLRARWPLALAATDGSLLARVRRILAPGVPDQAVPRWASAAPLVVLVVLAVSVHVAARAPLPAQRQADVPSAGRTIGANEAVIEGRVVEMPSSRPVPGATVRAMGADDTVEARSGDDGRYVLRVTPGSYTVAAQAPGFVDGYFGKTTATQPDFGAQVAAVRGRALGGIDVGLQPAGTISGRVIGDDAKGLAGVEVELVRDAHTLASPKPIPVAFAQTGDDGSYRMTDVAPGDYYVRAYTGRDGPQPGGDVAFAPTFYPGVPVLDTAQPLRLFSGQELFDVDFALAITKKFTVSGNLIDPTGGSVRGLLVRLLGMGATGLDTAVATSDEHGRFSFRDVLPGAYFVNVAVQHGKAPPLPGIPWTAATRQLTVDADVENLELSAAAPGRVSGRFVTDAAVTANFDAASTAVSFKRYEADGGWFSVDGFGRKPGPDGHLGEFSVAGGPLFLEFAVPDGWMVKGVRVDGADASDGPVDFAGGRHELEVTLTNRLSGVSGLVVDRNGRPLPNYSVVVFPPEADRWYPSSRFVHTTRSNNAGQFELDAVPPGQYLTVAVPALRRGALPGLARQMLEPLRATAEQIRVGEGQRLTIAVRASPMPPGLKQAP